MMFLSFVQLRITFSVLLFCVVLTLVITESPETRDTVDSRRTRGLFTGLLNGARKAIMVRHTVRARKLLLADSLYWDLHAYNVKMGGIKAARKDFSRLVNMKNVEEFYDFGRGQKDELSMRGKVGDSVVLFYPKFSSDVPYPVIRMVGMTPGSLRKEEFMVVYKMDNRQSVNATP